MASDHQTKAAYEYKRLLVQLSDNLTKEDCKKILFLEGLPKKLKTKAPLEVLTHLEALGKTPEDLIRLFRDINRHDVAKLVEDSAVRTEKTPVVRDDSTLDVGLTLAVRQCELLEEQLDHWELMAKKTGEKTREKIISDAKAHLKNHVHPMLSVPSGTSHMQRAAAGGDCSGSPTNTTGKEGKKGSVNVLTELANRLMVIYKISTPT